MQFVCTEGNIVKCFRAVHILQLRFKPGTRVVALPRLIHLRRGFSGRSLEWHASQIASRDKTTHSSVSRYAIGTDGG